MIYFVCVVLEDNGDHDIPNITVEMVDAKIPSLGGGTHPAFFKESDAIAFMEKETKKYGPYTPDEKPVRFVIVSF